MDLTFYRAKPADALEWGRLRRSAWDATYRGIYPDEMIDQFDTDWHYHKDINKLHNPLYHIYFLQKKGKNAGYLVYQHNATGVILHSLYLLPDARHQGIGRMAINHVRDFCLTHGINQFFLQCSPWNTNAMGFYHAMRGTIIKEDIGHNEKIEDSAFFVFSV